ncbi:tRNA (adenine(58)-N(1))-methyltransferase non-catalytic subunit TRM6-like [Asterias rubens]|uniref:tRNA (adenine(58)-N(1))-methyltransferase non-catalytic subunit TRM6-like n=1 Tax=Asterias rubens TaxID=7604 RepID=UPI00145585A2|nr:tRNA (adenine(58)-N(1))-methyltransferase non-catalytic subunit TRM6-like [Asterias rubens]
MATKSDASVIKQGQNVILKKGKNLRLYQVWKKRKVQLDKKHFCLDDAIGKPYGTTWEPSGKGLQQITPDCEPEEGDGQAGGADNRSINDDRHSQKLKDEDIKELRSQGKTGEVIIEQLVQNSKSFKDKTVYSQSKYLKRKREKHLMQFQILRPNTMLLCEMYGARAPSKNIHLRIDTLAQILTAANIQSGINVMMMETCQGLLLGAIMERMAGQGIVVQIHSENAPVMLAVDAYNFPNSYKDTLYSFPLDQLHLLDAEELLKDSPEESQNVAESQNTNAQQEKTTVNAIGQDQVTVDSIGQDQVTVDGDHLQMKSQHSEFLRDETSRLVTNDVHIGMEETTEQLSRGDEEVLMAACDTTGDPSSNSKDMECSSQTDGKQGLKRKCAVNPEKLARKQRRKEKQIRVGTLLHSTMMDTLVLACRFQPLPIFKALYKYLAPSRPFVVYCHYIEPLMECNEWLRNSGDAVAVNIRVTETWFREYQVLPERTHPHVNMSGTGGYILTGIKVCDEAQE